MGREPLNLPERLAALIASDLRDASHHSTLSQVTRRAAKLLEAPTALITLVASEYEHTLSRSDGDQSRPHGVTTKSLDLSFCKVVAETAEPMVIDDARDVPELRTHGALHAGVIAYLGVPLLFEGHAIGALCVIDGRPRNWSSDDMEKLRQLAETTVKDRSEEVQRQDQLAAQGEAPLLGALGAHLRSVRQYERLLESEVPRFDEEAAAQTMIRQSFDWLARAFVVERNPWGSQLVNNIAVYINSEHERRAAADGFAKGTAHVADLERAISIQHDALAALRITALDHDVPI